VTRQAASSFSFFVKEAFWHPARLLVAMKKADPQAQKGAAPQTKARIFHPLSSLANDVVGMLARIGCNQPASASAEPPQAPRSRPTLRAFETPFVSSLKPSNKSTAQATTPFCIPIRITQPGSNQNLLQSAYHTKPQRKPKTISRSPFSSQTLP
jgi:hypothetical protein